MNSFYRIAASVTPKTSSTTSRSPGGQDGENRAAPGQSKTLQRKLARRRRTNMLLMMVSLVFFIAWAPIHIYLIVLDVIKPFQVNINGKS